MDDKNIFLDKNKVITIVVMYDSLSECVVRFFLYVFLISYC